MQCITPVGYIDSDGNHQKLIGTVSTQILSLERFNFAVCYHKIVLIC